VISTTPPNQALQRPASPSLSFWSFGCISHLSVKDVAEIIETINQSI
jgi:hypothetical protein